MLLVALPPLAFAYGANTLPLDRAVACAPILNNVERAKKIAALLATRELAAKRNGVSVEGQEVVQGDDYKMVIIEDAVQVVRKVRIVASGQHPRRPAEWCVEVQEDR